MRILIYGINYAPELTGIGKYSGEMAAWLVENGHEVHVLTALPYYPEWEIHSEYQSKYWYKEVIDGVVVHRIPLYVPANVTSFKRIVHEFSFLASGLPFWLRNLFEKKFDVIISVAPPFHLSLFPWIYKKIRGCIWINHIQDLQVDAAKELDMIKNKTFLNIMFSLERFFLLKSSIVSTISEGMKKRILLKGIAEDKIILFPNWVDSKIIKPLTVENSLRCEMGLQKEDKIVLYSGNLGEKQGLESIIRAAEEFRADSIVKFVICGSGGGKDKLQALAVQNGLDNVLFFPLQPYHKLSALLAIADLHLIIQKESASDLVMPSKLTGILASGGCALVTALPGTSLYEVVTKYDMGIVVHPGDDKLLEIGIKKGIYQDNLLYKQRARDYAKTHLDKESILKQFESTIKALNTN